MKSVVFFSQSGCLLPLLILLNLFFGWILLKPLTWLAIEGILIFLFIVNILILSKHISTLSPKKDKDVIDVEGEVVEEKLKLK